MVGHFAAAARHAPKVSTASVPRRGLLALPRPYNCKPATGHAFSSPALVPKRALLLGLGIVGAGLFVQTFLRRQQGSGFASVAPPEASSTSSAPTSPPSRRRHNSVMNKSQDLLVDFLKEDGVVKHAEVERVLRAVDRKFFVDPSLPKAYKYMDSPLPIGHGETISAPHMHATCLELLREHLHPGARVLDVGSGSGYLTSAMAVMVGDAGKVIGIEKHPELAEMSVANVRSATPRLLESGVIELRAGNVLGDILENEEPFDAIHVGAAAESLPDVLVRKLKPGGRMVIPVGPQWEYQVMQCVDKDLDGNVQKRNLMYVRYVPLTKPGQTDTEE